MAVHLVDWLDRPLDFQDMLDLNDALLKLGVKLKPVAEIRRQCLFYLCFKSSVDDNIRGLPM